MLNPDIDDMKLAEIEKIANEDLMNKGLTLRVTLERKESALKIKLSERGSDARALGLAAVTLAAKVMAERLTN